MFRLTIGESSWPVSSLQHCELRETASVILERRFLSGRPNDKARKPNGRNDKAVVDRPAADGHARSCQADVEHRSKLQTDTKTLLNPDGADAA
jgi:hypothetical protein